MVHDTKDLYALIRGMREVYARSENAMAFARAQVGVSDNLFAATLIAYDLQAGTYNAAARANPDLNVLWSAQLANLIRPFLPDGETLIEVGCGEANTLAGVMANLHGQVSKAFGFDLSWSRVAVGRDWLAEKRQNADLFVGDLFHIPLADGSVDVLYTSHSLEPNGGRKAAAIAECLRVARRAVVLVEPLHDLASPEARARMEHHGYVRNLSHVAQSLNAEVVDYRLLDYCPNPLNSSGVLLLRKPTVENAQSDASQLRSRPLTHATLKALPDLYFAPDVGIAYPLMRGIPLLRPEHAVVASALAGDYKGASFS